MADLSDIEVAVVGSAMAILYPDGSSQPCISGCPVRIYRGWPLAGPLEADLTSGVANLSVFSIPGSGRDTSRWSTALHVVAGVPTLSVSVVANSATFGGVGGVGQVAGLLVDGIPYVYRGRAGDTPHLLAAIFVEMIRANRPCSLSGSTLTISHTTKLVGRVAADGTIEQELCRQSQSVRLSAWCPNPSIRDSICRELGSGFAAVPFLETSDGSVARISYKSTASFDEHQNAKQYRRDLVYDIEYGTSATQTCPAMLFGDLNLVGNTTYA